MNPGETKKMYSPHEDGGLGWDFDLCPPHTQIYVFANQELRFENVVGEYSHARSVSLKLKNGREFSVPRRWLCVEYIDTVETSEDE